MASTSYIVLIDFEGDTIWYDWEEVTYSTQEELQAGKRPYVAWLDLQSGMSREIEIDGYEWQSVSVYSAGKLVRRMDGKGITA